MMLNITRGHMANIQILLDDDLITQAQEVASELGM